jgi:hypothetical protein
MRNDPLYFVWLIQGESEKDACAAKQAIEAAPVVQRTVEDVVRAIPAGVEVQLANKHPVGDYFAKVDVLPASSPSSFRLAFNRKPTAGRYWKDVMTKVLRTVQQGPARMGIALDYRDDERPSATPVGK